MKKILSLILATVMLFSCIAVLASCENKDKDTDSEKSIVNLDINPAIELVVDKDNKIEAAYGTNEDAKVLLSAYVDIKGVDAEEAVKKITELAVEYGYIGEDNKVIGTTVSSTNEKTEEKLNAKIQATVKNTAEEKGITVETTDGFFFSIQRKYDEFKKENPGSQVTLAEFKLAFSAADTGLVSIETAVTMDKDELIAIIEKHHAAAEAFTTDAFEKTRALANYTYEVASGAAMNGIYMEYYAKNMLKHPDNFYYGGLYAMYEAAAIGLDGSAYIADQITRLYDTELNDAQIARIMEVLNLTADKREVIENADHSVTVRSIEAYVDTLLKNTVDEALSKDLAANVSVALAGIEVELNVEIKNNLDKESIKCVDLIEESKKVLDAIKPLVPKNAKTAFEQFIADYDTITDKFNELKADGVLDGKDMRAISDLYEEKAAVIEEKIKADLAEELPAIEKAQKAAQEKIDALKAELDEALNKAEKDAKQYLENARQARLDKYGLNK